MTTFARIQIGDITVASVIKIVTAVGIVGTTMSFAIAQFSQARFTPTSAEKLVQQAPPLSEASDHDGALAVNRKAVRLYRHLLRVSPIHYQPALAATLQDMSVHLFEAGDREGARSAIMEVIKMRRHLAPDNPRNIANLEESLRLLSRFETASDAANANTAQSSVR